MTQPGRSPAAGDPASETETAIPGWTGDPSELARQVLFIGMGDSAVAWYRCVLPALHMGADWVGLAGDAPKLLLKTGLVGGQTRMPAFDSYKIVVLQQPRGPGWLRIIKKLQARGVKVLFEIDDYLHAIRKMPDHDFKQFFSKQDLPLYEMNMRVCDGLICSTDFIARKYRAFNRNVYVCRNGVDMARYRLTRPERETVNIGWAGATGHMNGAMPWMQAVGLALEEHDETCFVSIGQPFASMFSDAFGPRAIAIPFTLVDIYPSAMTMFDIALGPAGRNLFFRGKSDLRWLEAGALGVPIIADPVVYPDIDHGVTGFHASSPVEVKELLDELIGDPKLRLEVGENAREFIRNHRDMRVAVGQWVELFAGLLERDSESSSELAAR